MIFVTGGTGLLGAHLLFELSKNDEPIRSLYRSQEKINKVQKLFLYYDPVRGVERFHSIVWVKGSILDVTLLQEVINESRIVYHCAAIVSFHRKDFNQLIKTNREGTANIVNCCLESPIEKLCYVSSTAAIGVEEKGMTSEKSKWKNTPETSGYSISKYLAEKEVWRGIEEGLNAVIVNPCVIFGAGRWDESSLSIFRTVSKGIRFYPPGSNATVDARDVVEIMIKLVESDIQAERFLCIGSNQSFKDLMTEIARQLKVRPPQKQIGFFGVDLTRRLIGFICFLLSIKPSITKETVRSLFNNRKYDNSKIKTQLNFEFRNLEEMVRNSIAGRLQN